VSNRPERVAERIKREAADIVKDLRDPRLGAMVSVTDVEVTHDLSVARIYVSILEKEGAREHAMQALKNAPASCAVSSRRGWGLREVPEVRFLLDTSIEHGARVEELLRKLARGAGSGPRGRSLSAERAVLFDGLLAIDKPVGITSHDAVVRVRPSFGVPARDTSARSIRPRADCC